VEQALLDARVLLEGEDARDVRRLERVEELAGLAPQRQAGHGQRERIGLLVATAPQDAPAHEPGATPLLLPGVTAPDLDGALANGLAELALDGADGRRGVFQVKLAPGEIRDVGAHRARQGNPRTAG
jgi:hypothetical protein